mmetsp:Transcript_57144/g.66798  ORF Transcript_57144/g.66798 Transcript_57144/m.66798 type:complete len:310 (-) Transcript_57144:425-1354(-)
MSNNTSRKRRNRWGESRSNAVDHSTSMLPNRTDSVSTVTNISEEDATAALIESAAVREVEKRKEQDKQRQRHEFHQSKKRNRNEQSNDRSKLNGESNHYQPQSNLDFDQRKPHHGEREKGREKRNNSDDDGINSGISVAQAPKEMANFGLSGSLAKDTKTGNMYKGVLLKFQEPPEARVPLTRWRFYVFRKQNSVPSQKGGEGDVLEVMHVSKQSAYLIGRDCNIADIPVDHLSLSKQHAVLQYRATPDSDNPGKLKCRPYLMDLGSTNGTFINGIRLEEARYYELKKRDVITLGHSSREYVLLTENTT